jgi:hypothetical protein
MVTRERMTPFATSPLTRSIVWIAAYPKSGNTWVRIFLANLLTAGDTAVSINDLPFRLHAGSRALFDELAGIDSSDLSEDEITRLRPLVYRQLAATLEAPICVKTHDRYQATLFEADATRVALYLIRNPLDVAVSYAHHDGLTIDRVIDRMADECFSMAGPGRLHVRQQVGGWSTHVESWCGAQLPVAVVRYEDLRADGATWFARIAEQAGVPADADRIHTAMEFSSFERLREQEQREGFAETPTPGGSFFRSGRAGGWRDVLNRGQIDRIIHDHGAVMQRVGYLSAQGVPV